MWTLELLKIALFIDLQITPNLANKFWSTILKQEPRDQELLSSDDSGYVWLEYKCSVVGGYYLTPQRAIRKDCATAGTKSLYLQQGGPKFVTPKLQPIAASLP